MGARTSCWWTVGTGSPSRLKARLKGAVRHTGRAPPLRKTRAFRLTRRQVFGRVMSPNTDFPALPDVRPAPPGGLFRFWAWTLRDSADRMSATPDQTLRADGGQVVHCSPKVRQRFSTV